jgi:NodT family efflux transporter outer membrane factor (OMF) lipoprotein
LAAAVAGCTVGPDYVTPAVPLTPAYKEAPPQNFGDAGEWKVAQPADQALPAKWWEAFGDPRLNALEDDVTVANQTLKEAEARLRQARAMVGFQRADEFPTISVGPNVGGLQISANQPNLTTKNPPSQGDFQLPFDLSYEIDLWGQVRRSVLASREEAQATAADLGTASLSLHAELARDYFELRSADAQKKLLDDTVKAYADALQLTENRLAGGAAPESDVAQAKTQLDTTRVQDTDIGVMRAQFEHAIAVLTGRPPATFSLPAAPIDLVPPAIPVGLPSELLERRPDIAAAERRVAEANEQIGIAEAAYFPSTTLSASAGFLGTTAANWFSWPSLFWAVGVTMSETLFDGGRRKAQSAEAVAAYDLTVATYRQTTLSAFQQVEDNLAALRILEQEATQQQEAIDSAENSLHIFMNRYVGGADTYLQVITAQTIALTNERNSVDILRRRLEASLLLIKGLGGGWTTDDLPKLDALR